MKLNIFKIVMLVALTAALATSGLFFPVGVSAAAQYGVVILDDINFRASPSLDGDILGVIAIGTQLEVLSYENEWYHVTYGETIGYVRRDTIFVNSSSACTAYAREDGVKLRGAPSLSSYVITKLLAGQPVKVKNVVGRWYFVSVNNECGYVSVDYLSVSKPGSTSFENMLQIGMEGAEVERLQNELYKRGFISAADVNGYYGSQTREGIREFQKASGLLADGIAGSATVSAIYDPTNTVTHENAMFNRVRGTVELLSWYDGGSSWLARGAYFVVTDVKTGLSFNARRFGGWMHADSEPVTAEDTAIMKRISGGSWSWNRRPIWITYKGRTVAASMHTMPHMANPTRSNNFDGHFCIHLYQSKVHETERECPRHQACVREAYEAGKSK